jgi:hypothetical protein
MNKRKEEIQKKGNRFAYDSDLGLSIVKEDKKDSTKKEESKKDE